MEQIDIDAAKVLKNRMWLASLKDFYEPEDVLRYFDEVDRIKPFRISKYESFDIHPPENFFTSETLKKGLVLVKERRIRHLQEELDTLRNIKIPKIENELKELTVCH